MTAYRLEFEIPSLPKMANGGHGSWRADHGAKMRWRKDVGYMLTYRLPPSPLAKAKATFTRCSSVQPDDDGLIHGFKPIRDALKFWGVIVDDHPKNLTSVYRWEKAKIKQGKIRVVVEEVV